MEIVHKINGLRLPHHTLIGIFLLTPTYAYLYGGYPPPLLPLLSPRNISKHQEVFRCSTTHPLRVTVARIEGAASCRCVVPEHPVMCRGRTEPRGEETRPVTRLFVRRPSSGAALYQTIEIL